MVSSNGSNCVKSEFDGIIGGNGIRRLQLAAGLLAILLLTFAVYRPVLPGSFLMDDERLVSGNNALVNGQFTPYSIWFQTDFTLATFGWWLERGAFGLNPAGYHVVNIFLQAISAILLWRLLARLGIPGGWAAAALFAVHPVCVNSVARIAELKNTLSLPFCLLSFISYLAYESVALYPPESSGSRQGQSAGRAMLWYAISLAAFVLALLAKTTVVMLPVVILLCAAWQRGRVARKDIVHTLPFFFLSLMFGLMSIWFQKHQALPSSTFSLHPVTFWDRLAGAGFNFWFYIGKAFFPFNLNISYPLRTIDPGTLAAWLPDLLAAVVFILCWQYRSGWGRHLLFGLGCFAVMLFPALGFFDAQYETLWQVSDHLEYAALAAMIALGICGVAGLCNRRLFVGVVVILVLGTSILCVRRSEVFRSEETLMTDTVAGNPAAWGAYNDLGTVLAEKKGDYKEALHDFLLSLSYKPDNAEAWMNAGYALLLQGKLAAAETEYQAALKVNPKAGLAHTMYARLLQLQKRNGEALYHFKMAAIINSDASSYLELASFEYMTGNSRQAVLHLQKVLTLKPKPADAVTALNDLAWVLATSPDSSIRNGPEAVGDAEQACRLTSFRQPGLLSTLAAAYAEAGRFPEAVSTAERAVNLADTIGDRQCAAASRRLLLLYRQGKPCRESQ